MKLNVKPAAVGMYHHSYDVSTITSLDFGQFFANRVFEVLKRDDISHFKGRSFLRLAPQIFPPYGKLWFKTAAFFVPEYQLLEGASALEANMNTFKGRAVGYPTISHYQISAMFANKAKNVPGQVDDSDPLCEYVDYVQPSNGDTFPEDDSIYDFIYAMESAADTHPVLYYLYRFTPKGLLYYKILKSVGIDLCTFSYRTGITYESVLHEASTPINVMPLLALAKIYCDMFLNSHHYNSDVLVKFLHDIYNNDSSYTSGGTLMYNAEGFTLTGTGLFVILQHLLLPHEQNMFTKAWNTPNSPVGINEGNSMQQVAPDGLISPYKYHSDVYDDRFTVSHFATSLSQNTNGSSSAFRNITDFGLRTLKSLTDFVRRNNLFGSRAVERLFARFGIKSDDYKSNYVHKLYEGQQRIDFSAVMSNVDNYNSESDSGKTLGAYAGFGLCSMDFDFDYKSSDKGYIIVIQWLQQVPMFARGCDASVLRVNSLDFYQPEYDGQGIRAIPNVEFLSRKGVATTTSNKDGNVFGFIDLYDDYREQRDSILGDFVLRSARNFLFCRDLSKYYKKHTVTLHPQDNYVQYYDQVVNSDLSDPFQYSAEDGDRFYLSTEYSIDAQRIVKSKSDSLMLNGSGDTQIDEGGTLVQ